jgi:tRNA1Val (adenine37-N6)-methyltransferase
LNASVDLLSNDTLFGGRLICRQFRQGYRFSVDAVLAAHFLEPGPNDAILDLGCGSGIIGLILAYRHPNVRVAGLEVQAELADLAEKNVIDNDFGGRMEILHGDLCQIAELVAAESFDGVVCNPPYRQPGRGRISLNEQRARARHELDAGLHDIVRAASFAVRNRGSVVVVYPARRATALITALKGMRLEPKRWQPVYSYPGSAEATLVLVEAMKNGGEEVRIQEPLYIYREQNGPFSDVMLNLYG